MIVYACLKDDDLYSRIERSLAAGFGTRPIRCKSLAEMREFNALHADETETLLLIVGPPHVTGRMSVDDFGVHRRHQAVILLLAENPDELPDLAGENFYADFLALPLREGELERRIAFLGKIGVLVHRQRRAEKNLGEILSRGGDPKPGPDQGPATEADIRQFFEREWRRCLRYEWPLAFLILAIDRGSDLAAALAEVAADLHRPGDLAGAWDEGRFAVVLSETDPTGAMHVARRIQSNLGTRFGRVFTGIACARPIEVYRHLAPGRQGDGRGPDLLIEAAGNALRRAIASDEPVFMADGSGFI